MLKLHFLGTGVAIVTKYYNTCFCMDNGTDLFLVDGGGGVETLRKFEELQLDWKMLHHAYLSHAHTDHILGMVWVVRMITFLMNRGDYEGEFTLYCQKTLCEAMRQICEISLNRGELANLGTRIRFEPVEDRETRKILDWTFTFFDIHSAKAPQFGFAMEYENGKKLVFAGDEPLSEESLKYAQNADWLLTEAFCLYEEREIHTPYKYSHSTAKEAGEKAEAAGAKNLILYHTEDTTTYGCRRQKYTEECRKYYSGNVFVPEDNEVITAG